jgi:hypothetical protein
VKRILMLAGLSLGLAGCANGPAAAELMQAIAADQNPVCITVTLTTPWGTQSTKIDRLRGCEGVGAGAP